MCLKGGVLEVILSVGWGGGGVCLGGLETRRKLCVIAEILSNSFSCVSSFPSVRLKLVWCMIYVRVISKTITRLRDKCPCCFLSTPPHAMNVRWKRISLLNNIVLPWTVLSKRDGNEFKNNTVHGTLQFGARALNGFLKSEARVCSWCKCCWNKFETVIPKCYKKLLLLLLQ